MKQVTKCANCRTIVKKYGSFTAMLTEIPIINGMEMPETRHQVKLCRPCARKAGYKVKYRGLGTLSADMANTPTTKSIKP